MSGREKGGRSGGLWIQDDWKVTPKLTLNLGLRWDSEGRYDYRNGTATNYDLSNPPIAVAVTPANLLPGWDKTLLDGP